MDFYQTLKLMESPQADNNTLKEYKKWCDANNEFVSDEKALDKFARTYYKNAEDIKKFIKSVINMKPVK